MIRAKEVFASQKKKNGAWRASALNLGGDTISTTINIVSIELWNPRAGLLAEVLRLKIKCYRKEEYLLTYLTQPLSPNLLFALGKEVRSVFKSPKWQQVWPPGKATLLTTGDLCVCVFLSFCLSVCLLCALSCQRVGVASV